MEEQIRELNNRLKTLEDRLNGRSNDPRQVEVIRRAMRDVSSTLETSSKSASSENKSVNESGSSIYSVMDKPDGFLEVEINSATYYLPYFS
jgi:small-conductance mechanosensitive channel